LNPRDLGESVQVLVRDLPDYLASAYPDLALADFPLRWIRCAPRRSPPTSPPMPSPARPGDRWFVIGTSPWANPEANDLGMFCYWATVVALPRLLPTGGRICGCRRGDQGVRRLAVAALTIGLLTPQSLGSSRWWWWSATPG
jgi:hypothetical protein